MATAGQISLDDLRAAGGVHDDFLDQMLGGLQPSAWPELASAAGAKAPEGGVEAEGMHHQQQQQFGGGLYDESALLASRLRQHQISGGGAESAAAAKQMVLQQLADLRHGHHMLLQGMGRSTGGGACSTGLPSIRAATPVNRGSLPLAWLAPGAGAGAGAGST